MLEKTEQKKGKLMVEHEEMLKYLNLLSSEGIRILIDIICSAGNNTNGDGYFFEKMMDVKKIEIKQILTPKEYKLISELIRQIKKNINSFSGYSIFLNQDSMTSDEKKLLLSQAFSTTDIDFSNLNDWANVISDD